MTAAATAPLLREPDFRRLWTAGLVTYFVRWLEVLVFGVFTYERTGSAFAVAGVTMLRMLPLAVFGVPFGALAARVPPRAGLLGMLAALAAITAALLAAALAGRLEVWHVAVASFAGGMVWAADNPLRRAWIGELAGPARMARSMALDVGASNACRLAGPAAGGLLLAHAGMVGVLVPMLALYGLAALAVRRIPPRARPSGGPAPSLRAILVEGIAAVRGNRRLAGALWITVVFNLFGWPILSMVPVIGRDRLGLGPDGVGLLASADGLGALAGAIALASLRRPLPPGRVYACGIGVFLAMGLAFAASGHPLAAGAALLAGGMGQAAFAVMQATLVLAAVDPGRRSQAMGLLTMAIGTAPAGYLWLGAVAERLGAPIATALSCAAGLALLAASRPLWRATWQETWRDR